MSLFSISLRKFSVSSLAVWFQHQALFHSSCIGGLEFIISSISTFFGDFSVSRNLWKCQLCEFANHYIDAGVTDFCKIFLGSVYEESIAKFCRVSITNQEAAASMKLFCIMKKRSSGDPSMISRLPRKWQLVFAQSRKQIPLIIVSCIYKSHGIVIEYPKASIMHSFVAQIGSYRKVAQTIGFPILALWIVCFTWIVEIIASIIFDLWRS